MAPATNECFALAFLCYNLPGGGAVSVEAVEGSLPKVHGFINFQAVSGTARSPVGRKQSWSGLESPGRGWRPLHKSNKTQNTNRESEMVMAAASRPGTTNKGEKERKSGGVVLVTSGVTWESSGLLILYIFT